MDFLQPELVIENCAIATMDGRRHDDTGAEHHSGHIIMSGGRQLLRAGVPVGLGVDGSASSEGTTLAGELHQALLAARVRDEHGPGALTARQALWIGTRGGAACLGRADEIGALRPGMLADVALWRVDTLAHDAIAHDAGPDGPDGDPVAALVFGPRGAG